MTSTAALDARAAGQHVARVGAGIFAEAVDAFERTGQLPLRPDVAELLLRHELLAVEVALLDADEDRELRGRQKLLEACRSEDASVREPAREQLRLATRGGAACRR